MRESRYPSETGEILKALSECGVEPDSIEKRWMTAIDILVRHSPRLASICVARPVFLQILMERDDLSQNLSYRSAHEDLEYWINREEDFETGLRRFHRHHLFRIALRDLMLHVDIQQITRECSLVADVVLEAWFQHLWADFTKSQGTPVCESTGEPAGLVVIALGKHGGRELNFSSDIDLMFVFEETGSVEGSSRFSRNKEWFAAFAQQYCDKLAQPSPDGFFYRIDTRLRPEGGSGEIATSLAGIELYYHNYGQNWERQALLKARCVAGDKDLGQRFQSLITPFTYRKYVDEVEVGQVLRDVDSMRRQSMREAGTPEELKSNFKNGYGGIRDIEFFVQAVQILYGGQYPEVKLTGTLVSLQRMHESHLLHSGDYNLLSESYRFLRRIEHRLQMVDEQQVYELPDDPDALQRLAESMQFDSGEALLLEYQSRTQQVRQLYVDVFHRDEWADASEILMEQTRWNEEIDSVLAQYEFRDTRQAFTYIKSLQTSPTPHLRSKQRRLMKAVLPRLLHAFKACPDPDQSLANFEKLLSAFQAPTALLETVLHQSSLVTLLVSVVCSSDFLTSLALRDPSLIDTIGNEALIRKSVDFEALETHLHTIASAHPNETLREHLLRVQNSAMLHGAIRFLLGLSDVEHFGQELAAIADFVLYLACKPVHEQLQERYPGFASEHRYRVALFGYGKLGGKDFNVASDCDMVIVYDGEFETDDVTPQEFFHRWTTTFCNYLQSRSALGFLYEPDLRLRPHGKNSPIAVGWSTFERYYNEEAQLWERMALTRARTICGWATLDARLDELRREVCFSTPLNKDQVQQIRDMRARVESEKGSETLKSAPGGLLDVEFIAQTLALLYGHEHPGLRSTSTLQVLRNAIQSGCLPQIRAQSLIDSYLFLREIENRLRVVNNLSIDSIPTDPDELEKTTRRYALRMQDNKPTPQQFTEWIDTHTTGIRTLFNELFDEWLA